jgi:hypothetical protein
MHGFPFMSLCTFCREFDDDDDSRTDRRTRPSCTEHLGVVVNTLSSYLNLHNC